MRRHFRSLQVPRGHWRTTCSATRARTKYFFTRGQLIYYPLLRPFLRRNKHPKQSWINANSSQSMQLLYSTWRYLHASQRFSQGICGKEPRQIHKKFSKSLPLGGWRWIHMPVGWSRQILRNRSRSHRKTGQGQQRMKWKPLIHGQWELRQTGVYGIFINYKKQ